MDDAIELADMIWQLRSELTRAMWGGEGKDLRFKADSVELELTVAVEKAREPGVKVRFWVLEGNAGTRRASTVTQVIRLTLQPVRGDDPERAALIGGAGVRDEQ
ncbi:hypothetical protein O7635_37965 [Asanoa sp. WMMD1127]|uniref:trypco2 family protein n=1 Tax=Asanoa sp. WMMD1127 TaxID=3016107 RepID=UPI002417BCB0|nr:trypco2 family protein [Asanoa sp. WMMD1127]MDG4827662.1 hypothetical protein [Asanoa sp. WMMD1127]